MRLLRNSVCIVICILTCTAMVSCGNGKWQVDTGIAFGTFYQIKYQHKTSLKPAIDSILAVIDSSMSLFNPNSTLSRINDNTFCDSLGRFPIHTDLHLRRVLLKGMEVSAKTSGSFDMTVGALVNYWGFGSKQAAFYPSDEIIDSIMQFTGYEKLRVDSLYLIKADSRLTLDAGAIAKGYAVDCVADYLKGLGMKDVLVDIGGEVKAYGKNPNGKTWNIGVQRPKEGATNEDIQAVLLLENMAVATSGNYRNYKEVNGMKYGHTIYPKTGRPAQHSLLSATVLASDCMTADAYATSFMVMGKDAAIKLLKELPNIQAMLIYLNEKNSPEVYFSGEFPLKDE